MTTATTIEHIDVEPWYRQFWPWFLFGLPATVVVACIVTIILAIRSPLSLVDDNYYKEGLGINEDIAASEYATELDLQARLNFAGNLIQADLNNEHTTQLEITLIHPTNAEEDLTLPMNRVGNRRYERSLETPIADTDVQYRIRLTGTHSNASSVSKKWTLIDQLPVAFLNRASKVSSKSEFTIPSRPETLKETDSLQGQ